MLKKKTKRENPSNLIRKLIAKGISLAYDTALYYIHISDKLTGSSKFIYKTSFYREKISNANNYTFNEYLKLPIFELLNNLIPEINKKIFEGVNSKGKIFLKMKFETFLFKKGFPFSKQITESPEEKNLKLPKIKFLLPECEGIYLNELIYRSKSLNSKNAKEVKNKIEEIKNNCVFSAKTES